jgi:hypothetical protein
MLVALVCVALFAQSDLRAVSPTDRPATIGDEDIHVRAVALVQQLGDEHFAMREQAMSELIKMGLPSRKALEEGRGHADREIRYRCERILSLIEELDFQRRLAGFAVGRTGGEYELPGWTRYRSLFGDDGDARKLFVEMQRAEAELMEAVENGPEGVGKVIDVRCLELQQSQRVSRQSISLGSIASLLFAAGDEEVRLNLQSESILCSLCYQTELQNAMFDTSKKKFVEKMLGAWITRGEGWTAYQSLSLAMQYDLKEGLVPAVKTLGNPGSQPYVRQNAILAIAKLGDDSHIKVLESRLDDKSRCATQRIKDVTYQAQIRDVALAAILIMRMQDPKEFGFDRIQRQAATVLVPSTVGFESDEKRNKAIAKWNAFKAAEKK